MPWGHSDSLWRVPNGENSWSPKSTASTNLPATWLNHTGSEFPSLSQSFRWRQPTSICNRTRSPNQGCLTIPPKLLLHRTHERQNRTNVLSPAFGKTSYTALRTDTNFRATMISLLFAHLWSWGNNENLCSGCPPSPGVVLRLNDFKVEISRYICWGTDCRTKGWSSHLICVSTHTYSKTVI